MLKVKDVHFSRGRRKILDGVSFDLPEGNLMALLGPSGCGKTTLLRLIAGFERLPQGEIEIKGQVVASGQGTHTSAYDRRVGFVFQNYALFPHMSVYDNITFGVPPNSSQLGKTSLAQELLEVFEIAHLKHKKPYEISGGEQQRVAIARALFPQPKLLLMDEPLAHLDSELRLRMIRELKARLTELKVPWLNAFNQIEKLRRGVAFDVQLHPQVLLQIQDVLTADVSAVGARVDRNPLSSTAL